MVKLKNNLALVEITEKGAEITSFYNLENNVEYMWQGNPEYWSGRNPILFPVVGKLYKDYYMINDKKYSFASNHGFLRHAYFSCVYKDDLKCIMEFSDNKETIEQYPFKFNIRVIYELKGKRLDIRYEIQNENEFKMPFGFGLHPAFNVPLLNDKFENYRIEFSNNEDLKNVIGSYHLKGKTIPLNYEIFKNNPTICFENVRSSIVKITNDKAAVNVGIVGYRWFAIWTKENAPYVCLEPWHSHSDFEMNDKDFYSREGTIILEGKKSYTTSYYIEIE